MAETCLIVSQGDHVAEIEGDISLTIKGDWEQTGLLSALIDLGRQAEAALREQHNEVWRIPGSPVEDFDNVLDDLGVVPHRPGDNRVIKIDACQKLAKRARHFARLGQLDLPEGVYLQWSKQHTVLRDDGMAVVEVSRHKLRYIGGGDADGDCGTAAAGALILSGSFYEASARDAGVETAARLFIERLLAKAREDHADEVSGNKPPTPGKHFRRRADA